MSKKESLTKEEQEMAAMVRAGQAKEAVNSFIRQYGRDVTGILSRFLAENREYGYANLARALIESQGN